MRKFYPLVAGLLICLVTLKTYSQENLVIPENSLKTNSILSPSLNERQDAPGILEFYGNEISGIEKTNFTCQADFEINQTPNSPLYKKFTAIPSSSEQKKPVYICWTFGDGKDTCIQYSNTFTGPYPVVHFYQQPGNYEVCVKIVYDGGCEAKSCKLVVVEKPTDCKIEFERTATIPSNNPLLVYYKAFPANSSNKKVKRICLKFGDGKDTCIEYPENYNDAYILKHEYKFPGNYEVCASVQYYDGCEAKSCRTIQVSNPDACKADFEQIPAISTINSLVAYYKALPWHNNNKKPKQICWKFGDGKDTCITYPEDYTGTYIGKHEYKEPGIYEVCVKILYYGGCEAYSCKKVIIGRPDQCKADFERIPENTADHPLLAYYKALTAHTNNKKPKQICWIFGDGKDTCITYPEDYTGTYIGRHEYREAGIYEVCVKILYYGGCEAYSCKKIIIGRPDQCKADFERIPENTADHPLLAYYKALTAHTNNKKPKQICWIFGDGKDTCITYPEDYTGTYIGRHEYREAGIYEVCIKILYYGGCEAYSCKKIIINRPDECKADFERIENTASNPLLAYYKALTAHNNNKKPKQICWRFGDGKDTCITYPEDYTGAYIVKHEYREKGRYEVCVSILYYGGCESKNCKLILIGTLDECKAEFERLPISSTANPLVVLLNALTGHNNNKKPKQICWKFGDGKDTCITYPENFTGNYVVRHEYREPREYEVCVVISYYGGCEAKYCAAIKLEGPGECKVKLFEIAPSITSLARGFYIVPWSSNNRKPLVVCLNFGDGTDTCIQLNSTFLVPQLFIRHHFPVPGVYRTCVKIQFAGGCSAYECIEVVIRPTTNICGGYLTDSLMSPRTFRFKGFAITNQNDPVIDYKWTFGDGTGSVGKEVSHTYNAPGTYEVCLVIRTQRGCETRICKKLIIPGETQTTLRITPNPVTSVMHALFYSTHNESVNIRIVNANGIVVKSYVRSAVIGANNWDFDLSLLTPGSYMIYIQSPNQLSSQLFIKN